MAVGVYQQSQAGGYFLVERRPGGKLTGSYVFTAEIFKNEVSQSGPYSVTMQLNNEAVLLMTSLPVLETSGAPLLNYGTGLTQLIKLDGVPGFYDGLNGWIDAINAVPPAASLATWTILFTAAKDGGMAGNLNGDDGFGAQLVQTLLSLYRVNRYQRTDLTEAQFAAIAQTALGYTAADKGNAFLYGDVAGDVMPGGAEAAGAGSTPPAEGPDVGAAFVLDIGKSDGVRQTIMPRRGVLTSVAANADTPHESTWMDVVVSGADWDADGTGGLTGVQLLLLRAGTFLEPEVYPILKVKAADTLTIDVAADAYVPQAGDTIVLGAIGWKIWTPRMDCGLPLDKKEFRRLWIKLRYKTLDFQKVMVRAKVFLDGRAAQNLPDSDRSSINEDGLTTIGGLPEAESDPTTGLIRFPIPLSGMLGVDVQVCLYGWEAETPVEFQAGMELEYQVVKSDDRAR